MRLLLLSLLFVILFGCSEDNLNNEYPNLALCGDFSCDTTVLRSILKRNNLGDRSLSEFIFKSDNGRIDSLEFVVNYPGLSILPDEIGKLTELKFLNFGGSPIASIPASIGNLQNLETLMMDYGKFTTFPSEIGKLKSLRYLVARNCKLEDLPAEIGNLTSLVNLNIHNNGLTSLPIEIGKLSLLDFIDLSNNTLNSLPNTITGLSPSHLLIFGNHLCSLPVEVQDWMARVLQNKDWVSSQKCNP